MKIAIIGISGFIGQSIGDEALKRGHDVVGIFRRNQPDLTSDKLTFKKMTIFDEGIFEKAVKDVDVIISAYNPGYYHVAQANRYLDAYDVIVSMAKKLKKRLIIMSGATSLLLPDGTLVKDGFYPAAWKYALEGPDQVYLKYKDDFSFDWTFVSPASEVIDTVKTGDYTLGSDYLILNDADVSRISVQDLADAVLNEVENPQFIQKRFTLGYTNTNN